MAHSVPIKYNVTENKRGSCISDMSLRITAPPPATFFLIVDSSFVLDYDLYADYSTSRKLINIYLSPNQIIITPRDRAISEYSKNRPEVSVCGQKMAGYCEAGIFTERAGWGAF